MGDCTKVDLDWKRDANMNVKELVRLTCRETIKELEKRNKIRGYKHNSYTRTEQLLYLYPYLEKFNEQHIKISNALEKIKDDKYYNAIEMRYFEGMTFEKIANKYNVKHQTIYTHNKKLVNTLAKILFPNEVAQEILND